MKLATLPNGTRDGQLVVVSRDLRRAVSAADISATLQTALDQWGAVAPALNDRAERLDNGEIDGFDFGSVKPCAPLPRAWQWLDGSAFDTHGELMAEAFGMDPAPRDRPLMYQGLSDRFYGPNDDIPLPSEDDGIDFEGEFGVIVDQVPAGTNAAEAENLIRLIIQINDWSLRTIAPVEMKTGFGWIQAKPACSVAGVAVTPDELGPAWSAGRVELPLTIHWNDELFGQANGREMSFSFPELIAHAAKTRSLPAGTIIGSGTVSNRDHSRVGSSCISERRAIEQVERGTISTGFMRFGDSVRMEAKTPDGLSAFGAIEQKVIPLWR